MYMFTQSKNPINISTETGKIIKNFGSLNAMSSKFSNFISDFKKYDLEQRIKKTALKVFEENIKGYAFPHKYGKKEGVKAFFIPISNNDNILPKIRILVENFKKYDLEKRISKMAIDAVKHELITRQIKETAIEDLKAKIPEQLQEREEEEEQDATNKIKPVAIDAVTTELITSQIKETAINRLNTKAQQDITEKIKLVAIDAVTSELVTSQIKETAIQELNKQILPMLTQETLAKQIILELIKKHSALIQTIIAIKKAAIEAVKKSTDIESIEKQLENLAEEFETWNKKMKDVKTKKQIDDAIIKLTEIEEKFKKSLETHNNLAINITDKDKQIAALKKKNEILNRIHNENIKSQMPYLVGLENTVAELKQSILQKDLENIAIQKTLSSLPKIAEPKNDVESSIKNTAINALKDSVMNNVIEYNKILFEDNKNLVHINDRLSYTMITKDLENIAKTTLVNELLKKSVPGSSTGSNIENDLKHAALTALYSALLGVSKEHVDPSKPPSEYDILITDKTYKYDEKTGERKEIPEFTKYDSIFDDSILAK